jgi:hypothetical protein
MAASGPEGPEAERSARRALGRALGKIRGVGLVLTSLLAADRWRYRRARGSRLRTFRWRFAERQVKGLRKPPSPTPTRRRTGALPG